MVRPMKCPYCGKEVSVSSHWTKTTCPDCKNEFEIGLEVFELSEEEQKKEQERALQEIEKKEKEMVQRKAETSRRLRQVFHLPEPDPHRHIKFEEEEPKEPEKTEKQKRMLVAVLIAATVLIVLAAAGILLASAGSTPAEDMSTEQPAQESVEVQVTDTSVEKQENDSDWNDGYAIDSNSQDGMFKIDLQSSDGGEQREPESGGRTEGSIEEQDATEQAVPADQSLSGNAVSVNGLHSSAVGPEGTGTSVPSGSNGLSSEEIQKLDDMVLNGVN